jgi:hypothetical protein
MSTMVTKDFKTLEEAERYLTYHEQEFNTLEHKLCPIINGQCNGPRCACWEPARIYSTANWHIADAWCRSPYISGEIRIEQ